MGSTSEDLAKCITAWSPASSNELVRMTVWRNEEGKEKQKERVFVKM